jgi:hypothetical protein
MSAQLELTAAEDERRARARLRAAAKGRRTIARNAQRRRQDDARARRAFKSWITAERRSFTAYASDHDPALLSAWREVLRERPELYGRRDGSDAA